MSDKKRKLSAGITILLGIAFLLLPLPPLLLEVLVGFELLSCIVLLIYSFRKQGERMPSFVLIVSYFTLAINVSLSRAMLMNHGKVPLVTFIGGIITQNNYIAGIILIVILLCGMMILVSKETANISGMAKSFSGDIMAQKLSSIDGRMASSEISQQEAEVMKEEVRKQNDFYSMMEGVELFVRGNAKYVIFLTVLNIISGLRTEKLILNKPWLDSIEWTVIYTTGNVFIFVLPVLIVFIAAGICVKRNREG